MNGRHSEATVAVLLRVFQESHDGTASAAKGPMTLLKTALTISIASFAFLGCGGPDSTTETASRTTTETAGSETTSTVDERREENEDGSSNVERTETTETSTDAPTPAEE